MSATKIAAIILIIGGVIGLAFGRFSFTKDSETARVGPISLTVKDKETVNVPQWVAIAAIAGGALLLMTGKRGYRT